MKTQYTWAYIFMSLLQKLQVTSYVIINLLKVLLLKHLSEVKKKIYDDFTLNFVIREDVIFPNIF